MSGVIKPVDILTALAVVGLSRDEWTYASLAERVGISASAAHRSVEVLTRAGIFDGRSGRLRAHALHEFLVHALKYVCPAEIGARTRGMRTGPFAEPLASQLGLVPAEGDGWVWPYAHGTVSGASFEPLHPNAPAIAAHDVELYRRLAVIDALRAGRAREVKLADQWLRHEFGLSGEP